MMKQVAIFAALALALTYGAGMIDRETAGKGTAPQNDGNARALRASSGRVAAISADRDGHFRVAALINGTHVEMMADTGATMIALTESDARRLGLDPARLVYDVPVGTANGVVHVARVSLDSVIVGGIAVRDVAALVSPSGALAGSLLGMSYIGALSRFELRGDQLLLIQ